MRILSALFVSALLGGCATMMSGPVEVISLKGDPQKIKMVTINSVPFGKPPITSYVSLEEDVKIETIWQDGSLHSQVIERSINPWGLLNIFNLFLGVAVDYSNGSFWQLDQNDIEL